MIIKVVCVVGLTSGDHPCTRKYMHSTKITTFSLLEGMLVHARNMCRGLELNSHEVHESLDAVSQLVVFVDVRIVAVVQADL